MMLLCVMLLMFSGFMETNSENFKIVGPVEPLVVEAGEDLVLPCSLQPNISAVDMTVEWIRTDLSESSTVVHLYKDHKNTNDKQMKSYRGRTALFKEELQKGNTSLKLSAVQPSDEGVYQCYVESGSLYDDVIVHVKVEKLLKVVGPAAPVVVEAGEDLVLPCSIEPRISAEDMVVEWIRLYLNDRLVHLYEDYEDSNQRQMESYRGRTSLFKEELKKGNTSLKLSAVQPSDEGVYQCYVEYRDWNNNVNIYVEVKGKGFHAWKIVLICMSAFAITLTTFTAYIVKDKFSKKQLSPAQCSVITYMRVQSENKKEELNLKKFNTSEEGYRRLIPAVTNCRKAQFAGCSLTALCLEILSTALKTENSSVKELDLSKNDLQDAGVEKLSSGLKSSHCKLEIIRLAVCKLSAQSCNTLTSVLQTETSCLKELDLSNNDLQDAGVENLSVGLKSSHCKLEILRLAVCKLSAQSCDTLQSVLQTETSCLKELDLSNNDLQDAGVEKLSVGLKSSHCKLEILRLAVCKLSAQSCDTLQSVLQTETSCLKELDLSNNDLQDAGVEKLSVGLKSSHCKLEILRLVVCKLSAQSCDTLNSVLQTETSCLKELDLSNNNLYDSGLANLFAGLKSSICKLQILRLALCNLGVNTCERLGSLLKLEISLKALDLSNNDLQDSGVELLCAGLKTGDCKLEKLILSGCMIKEEGCSSLASALSSNLSHLKELDLTYNHPGESGVKVLSARLEDPRCTLRTLRVKHGGENRIKPGLKKYSCDFTLDPNTVNSRLSLSDGNRKVKNVIVPHFYPDHPERFDYCCQVLCRESLTGRCYWEAQWSGGVYIAVTYKSIRRKGGSGDCVFGLNEKSWSLSCSNNSYSVRHNKNETKLSARPSSKRVGVYVDCPAGSLSFYSVSDDQTLTHLHTFSTTFTEPLCAGFYIYYDSSVCLK
ncbi:NACHT, LRR and PYD domains-containing protein 3-like isoform X1 [Pygocentrus nattereri]|uniref:NACHT, LRR and PYD domains-containing protein 3-like isoform X1 n=1 Tax=Pygocentrus nattereri TaxID=42514 RepID=UPI001891E40F|nr:NACHT, LRR and PYD domains-containing protein 3-like isoform X1 [Pygocentrus nattereri]XP_037399488.1 NACHT, LRR and PYD domains-containing protein 3-like isoform X1 [Pygocentrus nattereri]XP_037399489.1 NACHT, LRR and PYD domains-containing protein 3-like isoform X1 [Pygocentrus nattereri]XP_037399490.1 NACHT, LRR and PYD domains-containing protein 3-like isoform X1 [Pygocentrus nattereri]